eukprot:m.31394 g.31394  ORF g.31394 m.31394 type:complete len:1011 (-) comp9418_c0_seq1:634-3666(-)
MKAATTVLLSVVCALACVSAQTPCDFECASGTECTQGGVSTMEAAISIEESQRSDSAHLTSLSGAGDTESSLFSALSAQQSQLNSLDSAATSTLSRYPTAPITSAITSTEATNVEFSTATTGLSMALDTLDRTTLPALDGELNSLEVEFSAATSVAEDVSEAICPDQVVVDPYHLSLQFAQSGYGTFQMETGAFENDIFLTMFTNSDSTNGVLLRSGTSGVIATFDWFVLYVLNGNVVLELSCDGTQVAVSQALNATEAVTHSIRVLRDGATVTLQVDGEQAQVVSPTIQSCAFDTDAFLVVGTSSAVTRQGIALNTYPGCFRTVTVDGVVVLPQGTDINDASCADRGTDYTFMVDVSGSISSDALNVLRNYINQASSAVFSSGSNNRVAVVLFAGRTNWISLGNFHSSYDSLQTALDAGFQPLFGQTFTATNIIRTVQDLFERFGNPAATYSLIVLTDGRITIEDQVNRGAAVTALQANSIALTFLAVDELVAPSEAAVADINAMVMADESYRLFSTTYTQLSSLVATSIVTPCSNSEPTVALIEQVLAANCTYLDCTNAIAHASTLPTLETYFVVRNDLAMDAVISAMVQATFDYSDLNEAVDEARLAAAVTNAASSYLNSMYFTTASTNNDNTMQNLISRRNSMQAAISSIESQLVVDLVDASLAVSTATAVSTALASAISTATRTSSDALELAADVNATLSRAFNTYAQISTYITAANALTSEANTFDAVLSSALGASTASLSTMTSRMNDAVSSALAVTSPVSSTSDFNAWATSLANLLSDKFEFEQETTSLVMQLDQQFSAQQSTLDALMVAYNVADNMMDAQTQAKDTLQSSLSAATQSFADQSAELSADVSSGESAAVRVSTAFSNAQVIVDGIHSASEVASISSGISSLVGTVADISASTSAAESCTVAENQLLSSISQQRSAIRAEYSATASMATALSSALSSQETRLEGYDIDSSTLALTADATTTSLTSIEERLQSVEARSDSLRARTDTISPECLST